MCSSDLIDPLFPFGFGLSYTRFAYGRIQADAATFDADSGGNITFDVTLKNVGDVAGAEVVQLYVHATSPVEPTPENALRAFDKVMLQPGEEKSVRFTLSARDFARYDEGAQAWVVSAGRYEVRVGGSSRDLPLRVALDVQARALRKLLTRNSLVQEFKDRPELYAEMAAALGFDLTPPDVSQLTPEQAVAARKMHVATLAFLNEMPIYKLPAFSQGKLGDARLDAIVRAAA